LLWSVVAQVEVRKPHVLMLAREPLIVVVADRTRGQRRDSFAAL